MGQSAIQNSFECGAPTHDYNYTLVPLLVGSLELFRTGKTTPFLTWHAEESLQTKVTVQKIGRSECLSSGVPATVQLLSPRRAAKALTGRSGASKLEGI